MQNRINKIIHISDIHIRQYSRHDEYLEQFKLFFEEIKNENPDRICIVGDLLHNKTQITPELVDITSWFLDECSKICKTIIVFGNHDLLVNNLDRLDIITPIIKILKKDNLVLYKETDCYLDENVVWCNYGHLDGSIRPDIESAKKEYGDSKTYIGLYHDPIKSAKSATGYVFNEAQSSSIFEGTDFTLLGDIHIRQVFEYKGGVAVYPSSLIQQDFGELIDEHGYVVWDVSSKNYRFENLKTDYGFYTFKINDVDDIINNKEVLINKIKC